MHKPLKLVVTSSILQCRIKSLISAFKPDAFYAITISLGRREAGHGASRVSHLATYCQFISPLTDAILSVFAIGDSIEVIRDAFSDVPDLVRKNRHHISYKVRGIRHGFGRFHPPFLINAMQSLWDDVPWDEGVKTCGQCVPEKALFFAHADCWAIAEQYDISTTRLYQFATQTQPLVPWRGAEPHSRLLGLPDCLNAETRTPLASLLDTISRRLPPELQQIILTLLQRSAMDGTHVGPMGSGQDEPAVESGGTLFTQLAVVQSQKVPVLKQIRTGNGLNCHASRSNDAIVEGGGQTRTLSIRIRNIFGRTYISDIGINQLDEGVLSTPISSSRIIGLRFALGRFGLRAIRILYESGSHSGWLGDPSGCWFGNVRGSQMQSLRKNGDVRLQLSPKSTPHTQIPPLTTQRQYSVFGLPPSISTASPFVPIASEMRYWTMKSMPFPGSLSRSPANASTHSRQFLQPYTTRDGELSRAYRLPLERIMPLVLRSTGMHGFSSA